MTDENHRVFIVEDEVLVAFEMSDSLQDMGFKVIGPSVHLDDAKQKAESEDFDIAFLDVNLGRGKTSEPVAQILRKRDIPFVFITALGAEQIEFHDEGDTVIQKPVSTSQLLRALSEVLPSETS